jgi:hypothetical protein
MRLKIWLWCVFKDSHQKTYNYKGSIF